MKQPPQIILALDVDTIALARQFVDRLYPKIKIFKVGAQLFTSCGPEIIELIRARGAEVFLDLKFFDIPNTVSRAVAAAARLGVKMLTLHILGDEEMLGAAVLEAENEAKKLDKPRPLLIGVTVLTSKEAASSDVLTLAKIGLECGLDGVVCSAREAAYLRQEIKKDFLIVTPGIRIGSQARHDQKRVVTVKEAVEAGSNFLVVGRPILEVKDPLSAVDEILKDIVTE